MAYVPYRDHLFKILQTITSYIDYMFIIAKEKLTRMPHGILCKILVKRIGQSLLTLFKPKLNNYVHTYELHHTYVSLACYLTISI